MYNSESLACTNHQYQMISGNNNLLDLNDSSNSQSNNDAMFQNNMKKKPIRVRFNLIASSFFLYFQNKPNFEIYGKSLQNLKSLKRNHKLFLFTLFETKQKKKLSRFSTQHKTCFFVVYGKIIKTQLYNNFLLLLTFVLSRSNSKSSTSDMKQQIKFVL